jgi:hypothetical protein
MSYYRKRSISHPPQTTHRVQRYGTAQEIHQRTGENIYRDALQG